MEEKRYLKFEKAIYTYFKYVKMKNKMNSYRTIETRIYNHILPYFKDKNIYEITNFDYLKWQEIIDSKNLSFIYKKDLHICFSTFLNYCKIFYGLKENVASNVGNFRNKEFENNIGEIWTLEEYKQFIEQVDDKVYKILFELIFFTGVRLGEALGLYFRDIDFEKSTISIYKTATRFFKGGKRILNTPKSQKSVRTISIDNKLRDDLKYLKWYYKAKYPNFNDEFFVFGGIKCLAPTTIERRKNEYCEKAHVKQIKIHEFRHSHACLLFEYNVPIDEISYRLGHSSISMTTDIYLKYLPKKEKRVMETLNSIAI